MANHILSLSEATAIYKQLHPEQLTELVAVVEERAAWHMTDDDVRREVVAIIRWEDWEKILAE